MTGASIRIEVDDAAVRDALARLVAASSDLTPVMDEIGAALKTSTAMRFERGEGPGGSPWPPSLRVRLQGGQTLVDSGRLRASITRRATANAVEVGTNVVYAAIHQFGGTIVPHNAKALRSRLPGENPRGRGAWATVKSVRIPARPFLGVDDGDQAEITAILTDWLRRAADGEASAAGGPGSPA